MQKLLFFILLILCCAPLSFAQGTEGFVGYSFENAENRVRTTDIRTFDGLTPAQFRSTFGVDVADNTGGRITMHGFDSSVTTYLTRQVGLTGDFSGHFKSETLNFGGVATDAQMQLYNILGGPQVRFPNNSRATPFVRALFGVAHTRTRFSIPAVTATDSSTNFAMALGGGLDLGLTDHIKFRVIQAEYNPIFLKDRTITASDGTVIDLRSRRLDNFRFATGLVFR